MTLIPPPIKDIRQKIRNITKTNNCLPQKPCNAQKLLKKANDKNIKLKIYAHRDNSS